MKDFFLVLKSYLQRHVGIGMAVIAAMIIFAAVFSLYDLPLEAVWYACLLTLVVFCLIGTLRFAAFSRKHRALLVLEKQIATEISDLPHPDSVVEADYQRLLVLLQQSRVALITESDRAKEDMIDYYTLWAHQIKTPIAAMRLLLQESSDSQKVELLGELFKIEQYVEMVLTYLRLDSVSTDYLIREYPLDEIIRQALRKYARLFILKKLRVDFRETGLRVLTDEKWLCFVIEQLLANALKYTNSGQISLYAEGMTLVVADTGIGIRTEDLPRVFEKGFTGYNGRADKKSTGIGLYLCQLIIHRLGHTISVESESGCGTIFRLNLASTERIID